MTLIAYTLKAGQDPSTTGSVSYADGQLFDFGAALAAGSGSFTIDDSTPNNQRLIDALDHHPVLKRTTAPDAPVVLVASAPQYSLVALDWAAGSAVKAGEIRRLPTGLLGMWKGADGQIGQTFDKTKWANLGYSTPKPWSTAQAWSRNDVATWYGSSYVALVDVPVGGAPPPLDITKWNLLSQGGGVIQRAKQTTAQNLNAASQGTWTDLTGLQITVPQGVPAFLLEAFIPRSRSTPLRRTSPATRSTSGCTSGTRPAPWSPSATTRSRWPRPARSR
jgi:hypothetical protein